MWIQMDNGDLVNLDHCLGVFVMEAKAGYELAVVMANGSPRERYVSIFPFFTSANVPPSHFVSFDTLKMISWFTSFADIATSRSIVVSL